MAKNDATLRNMENQMSKEHWKAVTLQSGKVEIKDGLVNKEEVQLQFKKFLDVLKKLYINIPLVEVLEQMPNYVKFMKDILSKKKRLGEFKIVVLKKKCSVFLLNKLPLKKKDPGEITIVTPQLENQYLVHREGNINDVLVHADKFISPIDFIILDFEANKEVPIIIEKPFLATERTLIDMQRGKLTM
ncbi:hypothetical protein EPI10_031475 [Gossypium australe]|uniref:Uncharacterized protein n=1 Tax=Gossypium australe TaxID=47621 RepID=A0A5B6X0A3_9ROSI|nr:hypothetical protein EPI10_031475 [Gossypium australe]